MSDEAIQLTNNDASSFKSYAVHKGYWKDPYINYFSPVSFNLNPSIPAVCEHKPPEMSRGYFARVSAMRSVIYKFLEKYKQSDRTSMCQIVNLGSGYDTLYFNLCDQNNLPLKYVEIDFMRVVSSKTRLIKSKKALFEKITMESKLNDIVVTDCCTSPEPEVTGPFKLPSFTDMPSCSVSIQPGKDLITPLYSLVSVDLRNLQELNKKLDECKIDRSIPTLFVAECVLVYMSVEHSASLLNHLSKTFDKCCFLNYEMVNLTDKFGEIMLYNMQQRACKLAGSDMCSSIRTQIERFNVCGFSACQCLTLTDYYTNKLDKRERTRVESLEFLDENELLIQLLDHYCVCVAGNFMEARELFF